MRLGLFLMPLHDPRRDFRALLDEDREAILQADRLGYDEAWVGEHYACIAEPITDPLQFMASLVPQTERIVFGTAVLNLPQHHPATIAGNAALFDHLANGRFLMGIGPGGLGPDMELFGTLQADRHAMMIESIDTIHALWAGEPPYDIPGRFWPVSLHKTINDRLGLGRMIKPYQRPHPPVFTTAMHPQSRPAALAGARGWGLISANFMPWQHALRHWESYAAAAEKAGRRPDRAQWRLARSILVTETDAEAADYMARPDNAMLWYFAYLHHGFSAKGVLDVLKSSPDIPDAEMTPARAVRDIVICGSPRSVLDELVHILDQVGPFGGLLVGKKDWDAPALYRRSAVLLAEQVMPKLRQHAGALGKELA